MIVDLIFEAGVAFGIRAGLAFEDDRAPVRHDEPGPDEQRPRLAEGNLRIILPDQPRALRDEQDAAGNAVIDILGDLRRDRPGKIGTQPGDERRRNDRAGLQNIGACCRLQPLLAHGALIGGTVEEGEFVILGRCAGGRHSRWRRRRA